MKKRVLAFCLTASMLSGLVLPVSAAYEPYATQITTPFVTTNANGREIHFDDIHGGATVDRTDTSDPVSLYKAAISSNDYLQDWASIAYNVFKSQPDSYWDRAKNGWDEDFGNNHYIDLVYDLQHSRYDRDKYFGCDATGLSVAPSLKEVQNRAAEDLAGLIDRKMTGSDFLAHHKIDALSDKETTVIYSTVSMVDRYGATAQYGYNSFTIAFYDFQLHVLCDEDRLQGEYTDASTQKQDSLVVVMENYDLTEVESTAALARSTSTSVASSITNSESYTYGSTIGVTMGLVNKFPGTGTEANWDIHADFTFNSAIATAYSEEQTLEETVNTSISVSKTLPPHTKECSEQTISTTTVKTSFDCPVGLTYKVALFSMCGTCYDDNVAVQAWNTAGYEQRSFVTFFGAGSDTDDAVESLYQRATNRPDDPSYDQTYGLTMGTNDEGNIWCSSLDWNQIIRQGAPTSNHISSGLKGGTDLMYALDDAYPMSLTGGTMALTETSVYTHQGDTLALYPIAKVFIPWQMGEDYHLDRTFNLTVGETHPISSYRVQAWDQDAVDYHGFVPEEGTWKIVDSQGQEATSDVAYMEYDGVSGAQTLVATAPGTTYVKYFIPENYYYTWDGVASTNETIDSAAYKVEVTAAGETTVSFQGRLQLTGTVSAEVDEILNLNGEGTLVVSAFDGAGNAVVPDVSWEAREKDGITVTHDGVMIGSKAGTYHVRAFMGDISSEWVEVVVEEPVESTVTIRNYPFTDVDHDAWFSPAVEFVFTNRIMSGMKLAVFRPMGEVTRGQVVQVLYNMEERPAVTGESPYLDVQEDSWFADAVIWASENGIAEGRSSSRFAPNDSVTREELAAFLCRYAAWAGLECSGEAVDLSRYQDADEISGWARDSMVQALEWGILQGTSADTLDPQGTATRAQLAQMLMNLLCD